MRLLATENERMVYGAQAQLHFVAVLICRNEPAKTHPQNYQRTILKFH